jgi:aspartyl-tRNA(Asn)/glutamyl-tRNA(Gln) amidotransferase subunit B
MSWEIVIGLEVHTQLSTNTKIFSGASTTYGAEPNTQADAVSIALPGVLPVLNKGAVERAVKFGLAVDAHIAPRSVFARKNYFYPDLPKGYQISQFDLPVVGMGSLKIQVEPLSGKAPAYEKVVRITRAHLEEDAGKSVHGASQGVTGVDLNRAGTPLLEIVSEPDMCSAAEAVAYAKTLHTLVRWIGISDGNMQEGSFRCDVNVSVRRPGEPLGTRREIKNLNSFKYMQQAIDYEVQWQIDTLENGGKIHQATILFNPDTGETRAMRSKEDAHDYRYFPDPDLLPLDITPAMLAAARAELPELPEARRNRYVNELGLSAYDASMLTSSRETADYFEECLSTAGKTNAKQCANWIMGEVFRRTKDTLENLEKKITFLSSGMDTEFDLLDAREKLALFQAPPELLAELNIAEDEYRHQFNLAQHIDCPVFPCQLGKLITKISDGTISNNAAKQVFSVLWDQEGSKNIDEIIEARGLKQVSDSGAIEALVDEIIAAQADKVAEYRSGKDKLFGFFVGLAMKASKGKANPAQLNEVLLKKLAG